MYRLRCPHVVKGELIGREAEALHAVALTHQIDIGHTAQHLHVVDIAQLLMPGEESIKLLPVGLVIVDGSQTVVGLTDVGGLGIIFLSLGVVVALGILHTCCERLEDIHLTV